MRVLIADKLAPLAGERLSAGGFDWSSEPGLSGSTLLDALSMLNPDVLVVRSTRVERGHIEAASALSLVIRAGAGVNTIDLVAAADHGTYVANCPGQNSIAVAELVFGLILAIDRHIPSCTRDLRDGVWAKGRYSKASGLAGRTLGIVGMGGIGRAVARRARGFEMPVVAWSRSMTPAQASAMGIAYAESPVEVARRSDILTVHVAQNASTVGLIGEDVLRALGDRGILVNTARDGVVDTPALEAALERGLRVGLDVFPGEPSGKEGRFDSALARHPNVVGTHHIGASTQQAQDAVASAVCQIIEAFHRTGDVPNAVNLARQSRADHVLNVRHLDQVGVLAAVLEALRERGLNVQEMENRIFDGGRAASARIHVSGEIPDELVGAMLDHEHILNVSVIPLRDASEAP